MFANEKPQNRKPTPSRLCISEMTGNPNSPATLPAIGFYATLRLDKYAVEPLLTQIYQWMAQAMR